MRIVITDDTSYAERSANLNKTSFATLSLSVLLLLEETSDNSFFLQLHHCLYVVLTSTCRSKLEVGFYIRLTKDMLHIYEMTHM